VARPVRGRLREPFRRTDKGVRGKPCCPVLAVRGLGAGFGRPGRAMSREELLEAVSGAAKATI
jgi:hypothetical protein